MPATPRTAAGRSQLATDPLDTAQRHLAAATKAIKAAAQSRPDDPVALQQHLRRAIEAIGGLSELAPALTIAAESLDDRVERQFQGFDELLRRGCEERGWHIGGQWPEFQVAYGLRVALDPQSKGVRIGTTNIGPAGPATALAALDVMVPELVPSSFDPQEFIQDLARAYDDVRLGAAGQVKVFEMYKTLIICTQPERFWRNPSRDRFRSLTPDQFRARLSTALTRGVMSDRSGRALRLHPALGSDEALFIYQPAENRYGWLGGIDFVAD